MTEREEDRPAAPTEEAGETTAADTVGGHADTRPVGTGTLVKTADEGDEDDDK